MIISKDLFIFGEQIFATIIPEGATVLGSQQQQQQQPAIINNTTTTTATITTLTTGSPTRSSSSSLTLKNTTGAAEQVAEILKTTAIVSASVPATAPAPAPSSITTTTTTTTTTAAHPTATKPTTTTTSTITTTIGTATATATTTKTTTTAVNTKALAKQETVAVAVAVGTVAVAVDTNATVADTGTGSVVSSAPALSSANNVRYEADTCSAIATTAIAIAKKAKNINIPKERGEAFKIQKREQQKFETGAKKTATPVRTKTITTTTTTTTTHQAKYKIIPMVGLLKESAIVESDIETEQEPLVQRNATKIYITAAATGAADASEGAAEAQNRQPLLKKQQQQIECRLQLVPETLPKTNAVNAMVASKIQSQQHHQHQKPVKAKATTSPSSSASSTASTLHTVETSMPSCEHLNTNMGKSMLVDTQSATAIDTAVVAFDHAAVTFPFIAEQQSQLQQRQQPQLQQQQQQQQPTLQLTFQNINVLHNERQILTDVSGLVSPGELLAIMGPSGCGKTTLLDCLSGQRRIDSGDVYLNREPLSKKWRRRIGYVLQEEIFFTQLTLRETVMYTAFLRLPESMPKAEKIRLVDRVLEMLELSFCQQTKIGDYLNRGLSGGEKKRANIACELLTNPLLMLLDEPTSGLDSHSAISLMKVLKRYAQQEQKTIVITVHQPSSQMFHMFDKLLLLHNGRTAYFGEVNNIYRHFERIGVTIKPHYNPADFVLEQLKSFPDIREKLFVAAKESHSNFVNRNRLSQQQQEQQQKNGHISGDRFNGNQERHNHQQQQHYNNANFKNDKTNIHDNILIKDIINKYYKDMHISHNHQHHLKHTDGILNACDEEAAQHLVWCGADSHSNFSSSGASDCQSYSSDCNGGIAANADWLDYPTRFHTQFCVLSSRNFKEAKPRMLSKLNWFQTIGLALMAGAIWFQLPRAEAYLHDLQGWMFFSQTYWMLFALFGALNSFPSEREVISKERRSGAYRLSAYYLAKMFGELPLVITLPTVYLMISYPMLGCTSLKLFCLMLVFLLLNTIVAQSVGFFIGACCMDMNVSITLSALYTLATQLFGGYLSSRIPEGLNWIRYTSMIHYAYQNMQILEFREGPAIRCGTPSGYEICKANATTIIPYAEILKTQNASPLWLNTFILMMFFLVFRGLGYAVLRYVRCPKT